MAIRTKNEMLSMLEARYATGAAAVKRAIATFWLRRGLGQLVPTDDLLAFWAALPVTAAEIPTHRTVWAEVWRRWADLSGPERTGFRDRFNAIRDDVAADTGLKAAMLAFRRRVMGERDEAEDAQVAVAPLQAATLSAAEVATIDQHFDDLPVSDS